jgi:NOL1/NOP2/sun family putative RNA methylase
MKKTSSIDTQIPHPFLQRMAVLLGDDYDSFLSSLYLPARVGLRVNTLKSNPQEFIQRSHFELTPVSWCPSGFILHPSDATVSATPPGKHPYHSAGLYYLQEPSAMAAAEVLAPQPGETVLDLAAAPGGKATHLAALMDNTGLLVANEIHSKRVWDLAENLERCGVTNAVVTNEFPDRLADRFEEYFDRVLLDAPCSGEGMFRKSEIARIEWKPELVSSCALRQSAILEQAARMVKPGGRLAYTTCTFSVEENEAVIAGFLTKHPEFDLAPIPLVTGFQPARPDWIDLPVGHQLKNAIRIWPQLSEGEGHFFALLVKKDSTELETAKKTGKLQKNPNRLNYSRIKDQTETILKDFYRANLELLLDPSRLMLEGSYIYQLPEITPDLSGLKVIRPGWWLGSLQKGRFTPSHSFAMGMKSNQAARVLQLHVGDQRLSSYYSGESFTDHGDDGWVLVTVDGFPTGWGKRVNNVIKNFYPHGLRRQV